MGSSNGIIWLVIFSLYAHHLLNGFDVVGHEHGDALMVINIGVFIDPNNRVGKEQGVGMEIAAEDFNNLSQYMRMKLVFQSSKTTNPLQVAYSAIKLIKEMGIKAIITGIGNAEEVTLSGEIGTLYKVPILALSAASVNSNVVVKSNSFLVRMADDFAQFSCIKSLIHNFGWKKVIVVYEDGDGYVSSTSLMLDDFSRALQEVELQIEYGLALPPLLSTPNPKQTIIEEFVKVLNMQSRVFVHTSLPTADQLFKEAYDMGLVGRETTWIVTDNILSLFDTLNSEGIVSSLNFVNY